MAKIRTVIGGEETVVDTSDCPDKWCEECNKCKSEMARYLHWREMRDRDNKELRKTIAANND